MESGIDAEITALVAEIVEIDEVELQDKKEQHFVEDLGVDSMLALEILASLEKKYRIEIPEEDILELTSVQSTIDFVRKKLPENIPQG